MTATLKNILNINSVLKILLITGIYIFCVYTILSLFIADIYFQKAQMQLNGLQLDTAIRLNAQAISLNDREPQYFIQRAKILVLTATDATTSSYNSTKKLAYDSLSKALYLNSNDLVSKLDALPLFAVLSTKNILANSIYPNNIDYNYINEAYAFIANLKKEYANDVGVLTKCAYYEQKLGFNLEYLESIEKIKELRPDLLEWYPQLLN